MPAATERPDTWQAAFDLNRTGGHERRDAASCPPRKRRTVRGYTDLIAALGG
jgi:hypothetical protein